MSLISNYEYIRDWCNHKFLTKDDQVQVDLSNYYTKSEVDNTIDSAIESVDITSQLADVATSGSYNDLTNKPTIPSAPGTLKTNNNTAQTTSAFESLSGTINLHQIAKTGNYYDLLDIPIQKFVCNTPAATAAKVATITSQGQYSIGPYGAVVIIYFDRTNTASVSSLRLTVGDRSGYIKRSVNGTITDLLSAGSLQGGRNYLFSYTGEYWILMNDDTNDYIDLSHKPNLYSFVCSTESATATKVATTTNWGSDFAVPAGSVVAIYFSYTNNASVSSLKLKVGTTVASIKRSVNGSLVDLRSAGSLKAGETYLFNYNSSYWVLMNDDTDIAPGTLTTTSTSALSTATNEALSGSINLHKVSKTGSYNDLLNKPDLSAYVTTTEYQSDEEVIAASLNDLNNKINTNATTIGSILDEINTPSPRFMNPGDSLDFGNGETETNSVFIRGEYLTTTTTISTSLDIGIGITSATGTSLTSPVSVSNMLAGVYINLYSISGGESGVGQGDVVTLTSGSTTTTIPITGTNGAVQAI